MSSRPGDAARRIVVVGASLAGIGAVRGLRRDGYDGEIVVVGAESHRPYDRPPLSKEFLAGRVGEGDLTLEFPDDDLGADWRLGVSATGLAANRTVHLSDGTSLAADGVVVATGASPRRLPATADARGPRLLDGVHVLRSLDDARALRTDLRPGGRLVVVGAGFIGAEVASTAASLGVEVDIVEVESVPLRAALGERMGAAVAGLHERNSVRLRCGVGVAALTGSERVDGVVLADGSRLTADTVVIGLGVAPTVDWLADSGLDVGPDGVRCDAVGGTSMPGVVAVGDCSTWFDPASRRHQRIEHWTAARDRGPVAAATLLGHPPPRIRGGGLPYFWSDQYGVRIQFVGSIERGAGGAAGSLEITVQSGSVDDGSFVAVYRRGGKDVAVLAVDRPREFLVHRRGLTAAMNG